MVQNDFNAGPSFMSKGSQTPMTPLTKNDIVPAVKEEQKSAEQEEKNSKSESMYIQGGKYFILLLAVGIMLAGVFIPNP